MKKLTFCTLVIFISILVSCSTSHKLNKFCLTDAFATILLNDNELKIHKKEDLLLVANFIENDKMKAALIPKHIMPKYLVDKTEVAKGYLCYEGVILLCYGDFSKFFETDKIKDKMTYLNPIKIEEPKPGLPTYPPMLIEPLVYSFSLKNNCFSFTKKTVADTLLN